MKTENGKKSLFNQAKSAIRKYHSAGSLQSSRGTGKTLYLESQITQMEEVFIARGWLKPNGEPKKDAYKNREDNPSKKRKRENGTDYSGNWRKCYKCVKECTHEKKKCNCACSNHLLPNCPKLKEEKETSSNRRMKPPVGWPHQTWGSTHRPCSAL